MRFAQRSCVVVGFLTLLSQNAGLEAARIEINVNRSQPSLVVESTSSLTGKTDLPDAWDFVTEYASSFNDIDSIRALAHATGAASVDITDAATNAATKAFKSLFFNSEPGSASRIAIDFCMATYLKVYGNRESRIAYAGALTQRWVLEHPKTTGTAVAIGAGAALVTYWYKVRARSEAAEREEHLTAQVVSQAGQASWHDIRESLRRLDDSGETDRIALVAAQAELLAAGLAGRCEVFRMDKKDWENKVVSQDDLVRWLSLDTKKAFRKYPTLEPISASCENVHAEQTFVSKANSAILLRWNSLADLMGQLQFLRVLPSEAAFATSPADARRPVLTFNRPRASPVVQISGQKYTLG